MIATISYECLRLTPNELNQNIWYRGPRSWLQTGTTWRALTILDARISQKDSSVTGTGGA